MYRQFLALAYICPRYDFRMYGIASSLMRRCFGPNDLAEKSHDSQTEQGH